MARRDTRLGAEDLKQCLVADKLVAYGVEKGRARVEEVVREKTGRERGRMGGGSVPGLRLMKPILFPFWVLIPFFRTPPAYAVSAVTMRSIPSPMSG